MPQQRKLPHQGHALIEALLKLPAPFLSPQHFEAYACTWVAPGHDYAFLLDGCSSCLRVCRAESSPKSYCETPGTTRVGLPSASSIWMSCFGNDARMRNARARMRVSRAAAVASTDRVLPRLDANVADGERARALGDSDAIISATRRLVVVLLVR